MSPTPDEATAPGLRLRDTASPENGPNNENNARQRFKSPLDRKVHQDRGVLITWDNKAASLDGFMRLMFHAACFAAVGLLLENMNKFGFRVSLTNTLHAADARKNVAGYYPALLLFLYMPVQILIALGIEKAIVLGLVQEQVGLRAHVANLVWHFAYPILGIWLAGDSISVMGGCLVCAMNIVILLKVWSFAHTCWWAREKRSHTTTDDSALRSGEAAASSETVYPANLTVANLAYFTFAPTLCYEMDYPRKPSTNWRVVAVRSVMLLMLAALLVVLVQQWVAPSVIAGAGAIARGEWNVVAELLLKSAIPSHLLWVFAFYKLFHVNVILWGELLRFADCQAYGNWWEAENMAVFWRRWNLPVSKWCARHVYLPLLRQGYSNTVALLAVFAVSAVLHEYLISPPTRMFGGYFAFSMMCQVPLCYITDVVCRNFGPRCGNAAVWVFVILGSALAVGLHVHDYLVACDGPEALARLELSYTTSG